MLKTTLAFLPHCLLWTHGLFVSSTPFSKMTFAGPLQPRSRDPTESARDFASDRQWTPVRPASSLRSSKAGAQEGRPGVEWSRVVL